MLIHDNNEYKLLDVHEDSYKIINLYDQYPILCDIYPKKIYSSINCATILNKQNKSDHINTIYYHIILDIKNTIHYLRIIDDTILFIDDAYTLELQNPEIINLFIYMIDNCTGNF